ncbi:predicted protein [Aspergillus terreus NIH2624]|uniref:Aldehyde dehydrogenase domain-containing protein n=1 Tax=Aspergillus terreus (strain NIH 2624 / FGSC A1156) TaxID=341663 RepID=Q0CRT8_ASPTN|nr:uncharacterized protein ATEG_03596 [Aspergillus terreus NIH2624]EAU35398.1 predicted protein [Aspergillus terreus NIH2624]
MNFCPPRLPNGSPSAISQQTILSRASHSLPPEELSAAVVPAKKALPAWRATTIAPRQQILFRFTHLIKDSWDRLAASITLEQGKTFKDARGDVLRGPTLQPIELANLFRAMPNILYIRPGDSEETASAWIVAIQAKRTPSIISTSRHTVFLK